MDGCILRVGLALPSPRSAQAVQAYFSAVAAFALGVGGGPASVLG